jgi:hypothetical protein
MTFADKAYQGARGSIRTPFKRHRYRTKLSRWQKKVNRAHARIRAIGERANATLKTWKILIKLRCCPRRARNRAGHPRPTPRREPQPCTMKKAQLVHGRPDADRFRVRGFIEEGSTTTPFDMTGAQQGVALSPGDGCDQQREAAATRGDRAQAVVREPARQARGVRRRAPRRHARSARLVTPPGVAGPRIPVGPGQRPAREREAGGRPVGQVGQEGEAACEVLAAHPVGAEDQVDGVPCWRGACAYELPARP